MRIPTFANIFYQIILFILLFSVIHWWIKLVRDYTPSLGPNERLFPRSLSRNDVKMNEHRAEIAKQILKNYTNLENNSSSVDIRIVASNRGGTYLLQTVAFLLEQQKTHNYVLRICNVESSSFADLEQFEKIIPVFQTKSLPSKTAFLNSTLYKENQDYWACLAAPTESKYVLLIEDDSIVISEFSNLLGSLVSRLDNHIHVDFVKLYHPVSLRKIPSVFLNISFSIILSTVVCLFFSKTFPFLTVILLSCAVSYDIYGYGSQYPAELRFHLTGSAYFSYPESCCTPAVIFRNISIPKMIAYFNESKAFQGHAKDHILDESPFVGRQSDLNYVTHIGSFSSIRRRMVHLSDLD